MTRYTEKFTYPDTPSLWPGDTIEIDGDDAVYISKQYTISGWKKIRVQKYPQGEDVSAPYETTLHLSRGDTGTTNQREIPDDEIEDMIKALSE